MPDTVFQCKITLSNMFGLLDAFARSHTKVSCTYSEERAKRSTRNHVAGRRRSADQC